MHSSKESGGEPLEPLEAREWYSRSSMSVDLAAFARHVALGYCYRNYAALQAGEETVELIDEDYKLLDEDYELLDEDDRFEQRRVSVEW